MAHGHQSHKNLFVSLVMSPEQVINCPILYFLICEMDISNVNHITFIEIRYKECH